MSTGDRELLRGSEFDFVALDGSGHLAVVSTAGYGPIPEDFLNRVEREAERVDAIRAWAPTGGFTKVGKQGGDLSFWTALSERGVYCFDWNYHCGPCLAVSPCPSRRLSRSTSRFGVATGAGVGHGGGICGDGHHVADM